MLAQLVLLGFVLAQTALEAERDVESGLPSLRQKYVNDFRVGVGLNGRVPEEYSEKELGLVRGQFATITPANSMKMKFTQPKEGQFTFETADQLVEFARANKLDVCGHCLVWAKDDDTPAWFFRQGETPATRDVILERLRAHIKKVAGRYRGKVISWDVVNEALDDGKDFLKPSHWASDVGQDFIAEAFRAAHEADPDAMLIYNDYNIELPKKRVKLLRLLKELLDQKVPIHAVGFQGHYEIDSVPFEEIEKTIEAIHGMGLKVVFTELDLDVVPRARWWADDGKHRGELARLNPYKDGCPSEILERQAAQYARLFALFQKHADAIERVTFWDLHDGRSWLNDFPWKRVDHPLLFDRGAQPKPAFWKVLSIKPGS
jgi:endo-1,4-beta-xylanase